MKTAYLDEDKPTVGLIDADLLNGGTRHPNLVLMKIAGFLSFNNIKYRLILSNDESLDGYQHVYVSRVFTFTPIPTIVSEARKNGYNGDIQIGGTGAYANETNVNKFIAARESDMNMIENDHYLNSLSNGYGDGGHGLDMRKQMPDYHLYDEYVEKKIKEGRDPSYFNDYKYYSIGFLTRGCVRHCPFCVNKLESKVYRYSKLEWFLDNEIDEKSKKLIRPYIYLWDDNFLAAPKSIWKPALEELIASGRPFQFRQGLDERMLADSPDGEEMAKMLANCKYHGDFIFAFDNWKDRHKIERALKIWKKYCPKKSTKFYLFCGYKLESGNDEKLYLDIKELFGRIHILMQYGCFGYVMRHEDYKNHELSNIYVQIARWCNQPQFYRYMSFWEYCYRNQSFWEQRTKMRNVPNQISFATFERRLKTGYYEKHNLRLCKTLETLVAFINKYPSHRKDIIKMFNYKLNKLINPRLWEIM